MPEEKRRPGKQFAKAKGYAGAGLGAEEPGGRGIMLTYIDHEYGAY